MDIKNIEISEDAEFDQMISDNDARQSAEYPMWMYGR